MKRKALGRGLSALLPDVPINEGESKKIVEIPLSAIESNPMQPRSLFDESSLLELADSIRRQGMLQPLLVRAHPQFADRYQLIAGERRLRAARSIPLDPVPCIVLQAEQAQMLEIALVENIQRSDLNPVEEARSYKYLTERFSLTQEEIATRVGKSRESIANALRLLHLPSEVLSALERGLISFGHAKALLAIRDGEALKSLVERIIQEGLSVRDVENLSRQRDLPEVAPPPKSVEEKDIHVAELERKLEESFQTKVRIRMRGKKKGIIEIHFFDLLQMESLLKKWNLNINQL